MTVELQLIFSQAELTLLENNVERVSAIVQLIFKQDGHDLQQTEPLPFIAPIGLLENQDLRWYLEEYFHWPTGLYKQRSQRLEKDFSNWGEKLLSALIEDKTAQDIFQQWWGEQAENTALLTFSTQAESSIESRTASNYLFNYPWELLHYQQQFLLAQSSVQIRRNVIQSQVVSTLPAQKKLRILTISPRPLDAGFIDHRASLMPLLEVVDNLQQQLELIQVKPTKEALKQALQQAKTDKQPFQILHFDGHGGYDRQKGKGFLCFEHSKDDTLIPQTVKRVYADELAELLASHQISLVFLDACQTGKNETSPNASIAGSILQAGIPSVIAMTHSVLVETSRRFVAALYSSLASEQTISSAVMSAQQALYQSTERLIIAGAGMLHMQDWFVPVLYQQQDQALLIHQFTNQVKNNDLPVGDLPDNPEHGFIGRSFELFHLERLLNNHPYAVIRGQGGMGKTTIAIELTHWLVKSGRFDRCAFVSLEEYSHDKAVLDTLGKQLVGKDYSVAVYDDLKNALQPIQRVLKNESCLLLLDNMESLLADGENLKAVLGLFQRLLPVDSAKSQSPIKTASKKTSRLLFTTRESLPEPFSHQTQQIMLGELNKTDAKQLIIKVMAQQGIKLKHDDQGKTPKEVEALISAVNGHARALVLLASHLEEGVSATTENLQAIMQKLEEENPGKRENSLFASLELSLKRLTIEIYELIKGLSVFHDGGTVSSIAQVLNIETDATAQIIVELTLVGLAEYKADAYLRLDPALPNYLAKQCSDAEKQHYQQRWLEAISQLVEFLYQQLSKDTKLAAILTQLELPNLIAFIRELNKQLKLDQIKPDIVTNKAGRIEQLLENIDHSQALLEVVSIRQQASKQLGEWGKARFETERLSIERHLSLGEIQQACQAAEKLFEQCEQAGAEAYVGGSYDFAFANTLLGRVLNISGAADQALPYLQQAQQLFETLGKQGARMASVSLIEQGECLTNLGRFDKAIEVYRDGIRLFEKQDAMRDLAAAKSQLSTVHMLQKDYTAALQGYHEALELFKQLNESSAEASIWHQIGMIYKERDQFNQAESAYRQSLSIKTQQGDRAGEASSLNGLANVYYSSYRLEQAVDYYQRAATIYSKLGDKRYEGYVRNNIASLLIKLKRLQQARPELLQAIECNEFFGHAAEPWKTWNNLYDLEQADGNLQAAKQARKEAIKAFLDYRRDNGENHSGAGRLALDVLQAIQQGDTVEIVQMIEQKIETDAWQEHKPFLKKLQAILDGERAPVLAEDNEMCYDDVVELKILLEQL